MSAEEMATLTATTKRYPAAAGGKVGAAVANLAAVLVVPLMPINPDLLPVVDLEAPREAKVTYAFAGVDGVLPDIREGDFLTVGGVEYITRSVAEWPRPAGGSYLEIIVEEEKVTA